MLYVLGGGPQSPSTNVYYSRINGDGTLAGWNQTVSLPQPLIWLGAVAAQGKIFVACGQNVNRYVNNSYSASVAGDGSLGAWSEGPLLPQPMELMAMTVADGYIFVAGGIGGPEGITIFNEVYSLALPPPPTVPILSPQRSGTNGAFQLILTSTTNTGFGLLDSTNLTTWSNIGWGFTGTNGSLLLQDTNATLFPNRFYRAYWPLP